MEFKDVYPKETFVYFLLKNKEVVYVGQTINGLNRIKQHFIENKKDFDDYKTVSCIRAKLNELENYYIIKYQPKYNKILNHEKIKVSYIIYKLKDTIGFNPYSLKRIEEIMEKAPFKKYEFKKGKNINKEHGDLIVDFLIKMYNEENEKIKEYFEKKGR